MPKRYSKTAKAFTQGFYAGISKYRLALQFTELLRKHKMTVEELSAKVDIPVNIIKEIFDVSPNGFKNLGIMHLATIAAVFDIAVSAKFTTDSDLCGTDNSAPPSWEEEFGPRKNKQG